jgi:hypothetical protein
MTVLPLVDLFILLGTGSVAVGFVLKAVALTTMYRPTFLGFSSLDMLLIATLCFAMALVLTARTWLKLNEPHLHALQRRIGEEEARRRALEINGGRETQPGLPPSEPRGAAVAAQAPVRSEPRTRKRAKSAKAEPIASVSDAESSQART